MASLRVVKHLDVIEHIAACVVSGQIDPAFDPLAFQELEEAFGHCIIVAVTTPAHAANDVVGLQEGLPLLPGELAALIRVQHQPRCRLAPPYGCQQGLQHQIGLHPAVHGPAHNLP